MPAGSLVSSRSCIKLGNLAPTGIVQMSTRGLRLGMLGSGGAPFVLSCGLMFQTRPHCVGTSAIRTPAVPREAHEDMHHWFCQPNGVEARKCLWFDSPVARLMGDAIWAKLGIRA